MTEKPTRVRLAQSVASIPPSGIRRFFELANSVADCISLGVGEPDFVTPWRIREAAIASLEAGYTTYTANAGLPELREAIAAYLFDRFGLSYRPEDQIVVTVGASEAIDLALRAILDPGDEVLVVEPCYVSYAANVRLCGGVPVSVPTTKETGFRLRAAELRKRITPRTKALIFSYPNNPTGAVMGEEDWLEVLAVVREAGLIVIADEIYAELTYDRPFVSFASFPAVVEQTILVSGFSKAFAMTGWRLGYACGPADLIAGMVKIHQYTMLCAPILSQKAGIEALRHGRDDVARMVEAYRQRRNFFVKGLCDIGLPCHRPEGAFYAFPSVEPTGLSATEFAERLLLEGKVAVVPGDVFGAGGAAHVRCSYATSLEALEKALERMARFVQHIRPV